MFESLADSSTGASLSLEGSGGEHRTTDEQRLTTDELAAWLRAMVRLDRSVDDGERITQLRLLEQLKAVAAAVQAVVTTDLVTSQRAEQVAAGVPRASVGQGIAAQVALARRESPHRGSRHVGLAQALCTELPATMAALSAGRTSEWRATIVARETACLDPDDRRAADRELGPLLERLGDRETEARARAVAYRLDPQAFVDRTRGAHRDRRVTMRPAPDTMSRLTGFLPVAQGVAALAALTRDADGLRAAGDTRSRSQIMADLMVERLTGQAAASATPVEVHLVVPEATLFGGGNEPAHLVDGGPLPAGAARDLVREAAARVWLRRVFSRPGAGCQVALESRRRAFPPALRRVLVVRDEVCRTPWCGAPVRHADHVVPVSAGGSTTEANGQGLCEACNYAKEAPGWRARAGPGGAGRWVDVVTPTGHTYRSHPPPLPGARQTDDGRHGHSSAEAHLRLVLAAA